MARPRLVLAVLVFLLTIHGVAFGGGLSFDHNGAAAMGMANAFAGVASDPSAIFYNPAGITQLPGTQFLVGTSVVYLDTVFRSSTTGEPTHLEDQFPLVPHFYITHRFKSLNDRLSVGLGIYRPFGLLIDWPDNWQGRFDSIFAKLRVTVINPTVALQVTPNLSVATGFRYANVAAEFQQKFDAGTGESKARVFDATANPIGWNVGLLYHATETTAVGIQFRSEIQAKLNGSAEFSGPAAMLFANTAFHSSIKMPPQLVVGISTKVIPRWRFNVDIEWQGWRTLGSIQNTLRRPHNPFSISSCWIPRGRGFGTTRMFIDSEPSIQPPTRLPCAEAIITHSRPSRIIPSTRPFRSRISMPLQVGLDILFLHSHSMFRI